MKECATCHIVKAPSEFYKDPYRASGLAYRCKACEKDRYREYYAKNRERLRRAYKERYPGAERQRCLVRNRERAKLFWKWVEQVEQKECLRCHRMLPLTAFAVYRPGLDGVRDECRQCCSTKAWEQKVERLRRVCSGSGLIG